MSNRRALRSLHSVSPTPFTFLVGGVIVLIVAILIFFVAGAMTHVERARVTVLDTEHVCQSSGSGDNTSITCKYLIYTETGTYELTDSIMTMRWNTSDIYGRIRPCHVYDIKARGYRVPWISTYPNIETITDVGIDETC